MSLLFARIGQQAFMSTNKCLVYISFGSVRKVWPRLNCQSYLSLIIVCTSLFDVIYKYRANLLCEDSYFCMVISEGFTQLKAFFSFLFFFFLIQVLIGWSSDLLGRIFSYFRYQNGKEQEVERISRSGILKEGFPFWLYPEKRTKFYL